MKLVYIVEDDLNIQEIESFALRNSGYEVISFNCAKKFYEECENKTPSLVILDVMLPDEDGLQIIQKFRKNLEWKAVPVLMVTAKTSEMDKVKGLDFGADDYLAKPFGVMELIARVNALMRRAYREVEEDSITVGGLTLDEKTHRVESNHKFVELTFKEYELLKLLIKNKGMVMTRDIIMDKVWGMDYAGESRTVDMHIKTLRHKLGDEGKQIKTVRNVGYRLDE